MVFHGDYEVQFEVYETKEGDIWPSLVGHMAGINPEDAKVRWLEQHRIPPQEENRIAVVFPGKK